jgi:hypothetical protein
MTVKLVCREAQAEKNHLVQNTGGNHNMEVGN